MNIKYRNLLMKSKGFAVKNFLLAFALTGIFAFQSCGNDKDEILPGQDEPGEQVSLELRASDKDKLLANALLYRFKETSPDHNFVARQLNVSLDADKLKTFVEAKRWKFVLLTSDNSLSGKIIEPAFNATISSSAMYKLGTYAFGTKTCYDEIDSTFYYSVLKDTKGATSTGIVDVVANTANTADANFIRKVAKVSFTLSDYTGFMDPSIYPAALADSAYIELYNCPTQLMWDGKVNLANYATANKPFHKKIKFKSGGTFPKAEVLEFHIPMSGVLASGENQSPRTKLMFKITMPLSNGSSYSKVVEISKTTPPASLDIYPEENSIINVNIKKFSGEPDTKLDVQFDVKEWNNTYNQDHNSNDL